MKVEDFMSDYIEDGGIRIRIQIRTQGRKVQEYYDSYNKYGELSRMWGPIKNSSQQGQK